MQALVARLLPAIQTEVGFALIRRARVDGRDPRQEVRDFAHDIFLQLLANQGKTLRSWDPTRGRSLESFVRLVARRQVAATLRSGRRNPWTDTSIAHDELEREPGDTSGSGRYATHERLDRVLAQLERRLDERGRLLFRMLYVDEREVEEVMETTGMTRDAVYAWRSRFRKLVASLAEPTSDPNLTPTKGEAAP